MSRGLRHDADMLQLDLLWLIEIVLYRIVSEVKMTANY